MNQEDKHIRKKLQEALEDYVHEPPVSWNKIDNELSRYYILKRKRNTIIISIFLITIMTFISIFINYKTKFSGNSISTAFSDKNTKGSELFNSSQNLFNLNSKNNKTIFFQSESEFNSIKNIPKDSSNSPVRSKNLISFGSATFEAANQNYSIGSLDGSKDSSSHEKMFVLSAHSPLVHKINNIEKDIDNYDLNVKTLPRKYFPKYLHNKIHTVNIYNQSNFNKFNVSIDYLKLDSFISFNNKAISEILELGKMKVSAGDRSFLGKVNSSTDSLVFKDSIIYNTSVTNTLDSLIAKINAKSTQSTNSKKVTIGLSITPQQVFRSVNGTTETYKKLAEVRNNRESAKYGIAIDLSILYRVTNNFELGTGVNYSTLGYKGHLYNLFDDDDQKYDNTFSFIGIPLLSNLQFGKRNINVSWSNSVLMSINTNSFDKDGKQNSYFYDKGKGDIIDDDDHSNNAGNNSNIELINPSYQYRSIMFSYSGALLLNFNFFTNSRLSIGPSLNYYFSSMYKSNQIIETPYSYGLKVGYSYSF